jgi:uncharacterized protein (DUF3820 family)
MQMPFGKFKGQEVTACPHWYLTWLVNKVPLHGQLQEEVCQELGIEIDRLKELREQVEALKQENLVLKATLAQSPAAPQHGPTLAPPDPDFVTALKKLAKPRPRTLRLFQDGQVG